MTTADVLHAAADEVENWPTHHADRELRHGAGGAIYTLLFEAAKQRYGWTAIQHLQHHLRGELPHGQLQHWRTTDRAAVAKALRDAAGQPPADDLEAATLHTQLAGFRQALADAVGWHHLDVATLVREVADRATRDRERLTRLHAALHVALHHARPDGGDARDEVAGARMVLADLRRMLGEPDRCRTDGCRAH